MLVEKKKQYIDIVGDKSISCSPSGNPGVAQVWRLSGSHCSLLGVSANPEEVSELSCTPSGTSVSCEVTTRVLVFLSADRAFASAPSGSRTTSIMGTLDPQRAADSVTSWWPGKHSCVCASASSFCFPQLSERPSTVLLCKEIAQVTRESSTPRPRNTFWKISGMLTWRDRSLKGKRNIYFLWQC